jgi:hypothetical protein
MRICRRIAKVEGEERMTTLDFSKCKTKEDYPRYVEEDIMAEESLKQSREEEWSEFLQWKENRTKNLKED